MTYKTNMTHKTNPSTSFDKAQDKSLRASPSTTLRASPSTTLRASKNFLVSQESSVLHKKAKPVPLSALGEPTMGGPTIKRVIARMKKALMESKHGVAIAAPQIGESLRIFLTYKKPVVARETAPSSTSEVKEVKTSEVLIFINPVILKKSRKKEWLTEGCLSVPDVYGEVFRHSQVTVRAFDEKGKKFTRGAGGLMAQIIQHEVDHLNGVLFIEKARNLEKISNSQF